MPEPLASHDISRRTFDVARRGYEQQEVRGFLHEVSALVEKLGRDEVELRERAERAEARLGMAEKPDEATLLEVLGEETTRVLTSAREAAAEIRSKAEQAAERTISEATAEASEARRSATEAAEALMGEARTERDSILETARTELDRRSGEAQEAAARIREEAQAQAKTLRDEGAADLARARDDAEAVLEAARQEGRAMVAEAQAVRERVLRDLAVRRKKARLQVEKLNAGRERLLTAYDVVRRTVDEATDELAVALSDARVAADAAARRIEDETEPTLEQLDAEVSTAGLVDLPIAELDHDHDDDTPGPFSGQVPAVASTEPDAAIVAAPSAADGPAVDTSELAPADDTVAAPEPAADVSAASAPTALEDRRTRKGRRRKGFEGLPVGALNVVEPTSEIEGVRILAEPVTEPVTADDTAAPVADAALGAGVEPPEVESSGATADQSPVDEPAEQPAPTEPTEADDAASATAGEFAEPGAAGNAVPSADAADAPDEADPAGADGHASAAQVFARLRAGQTEPATSEAAASEAAASEVVTSEAATSTAASEPAAAADTSEPATSEPAAAAETAEADADAGASVGEEEDAGRAASPAFAARAEAVDTIEKELARRIKRSLADEQNEVLDLLRRAKPKGVDDLLPDLEEHAARWSGAAAPALVDAARAGATWAGSATVPATGDLAGDLASALTMPLRDRIDRSFAASDGNVDDVADRVRALYREWKGQRLADAIRHHVAAAYARGVFAAIDAGSPVQWVVDPSAAPCPDCDDNVLAGQIPKGEDFPTGNPCAPAHPGCHCLVLAAGA